MNNEQLMSARKARDFHCIITYSCKFRFSIRFNKQILLIIIILTKTIHKCQANFQYFLIFFENFLIQPLLHPLCHPTALSASTKSSYSAGFMPAHCIAGHPRGGAASGRCPPARRKCGLARTFFPKIEVRSTRFLQIKIK